MTRPQPVADPAAYFGDRGHGLRIWNKGSDFWVDLLVDDSVAQPRCGQGGSEKEAAQEAVRRWKSEQEPPDNRRRPGEPLPWALDFAGRAAGRYGPLRGVTVDRMAPRFLTHAEPVWRDRADFLIQAPLPDKEERYE